MGSRNAAWTAPGTDAASSMTPFEFTNPIMPPFLLSMKKPDPAPLAVSGRTPYGAANDVDVAGAPAASTPDEPETPATVVIAPLAAT